MKSKLQGGRCTSMILLQHKWLLSWSWYNDIIVYLKIVVHFRGARDNNSAQTGTLSKRSGWQKYIYIFNCNVCTMPTGRQVTYLYKYVHVLLNNLVILWSPLLWPSNFCLEKRRKSCTYILFAKNEALRVLLVVRYIIA